MSILDLVDDGTIEWLIRGEGYSFCRAPHEDDWRYRADVWNGIPEGEEGHMWKCSPKVISGTKEYTPEGMALFVNGMIEKLSHDYRNDAVGLPRVEALRRELADMYPLDEARVAA